MMRVDLEVKSACISLGNLAGDQMVDGGGASRSHEGLLMHDPRGCEVVLSLSVIEHSKKAKEVVPPVNRTQV